MGRQAYITRQALGRSAFEPLETAAPRRSDAGGDIQQDSQPVNDTQDASPNASEQYVQQYDARGHPTNPASRSLVRSQIRAQNDVLATVGVCVGVKNANKQTDSQPRFKSEKEHLDSIMRENEIGLVVSTTDLGLHFFGTWWIHGLRNRLQTFPMWSDIYLRDMARLQLKHYGVWSFFLAGMPAHIVFLLLNAGKDFALAAFHQWAYTSLAYGDPSRRRRRRKKQALVFVDHLLNLAGFTLLAPLYMFSTLQILSLLPAYPLFPRVRAMVPFSAASPLQAPQFPTSWTLQSALRFGLGLMRSPLAIVGITSYVAKSIENESFKYLRRALPKPENPDALSLRGAIEDDLDSGTIPGLASDESYVADQVRPLDQLYNVLEEFSALKRWVMGILGTHQQRSSGSSSTFAIIDADSDDGDPPQRTDPTAVEVARADHTHEGHEAHERTLDLTIYPENNPSLHEDNSSGEESAADRRPTGVRVANHHGDNSDAITMEVEIPGGAPMHAESPSLRRRESIVHEFEPHRPSRHPSATNDPERHVTCLSSHPSDSAASHLSSFLTQVLTLPLETLLVRTIATSFMAAASVHQNGAMLPSTYAPFSMERRWWQQSIPGRWNGRYVTNLATCAGLEIALSFGLFEVGYFGVTWFGKRAFGWGQL
ncbi:MAG: hypothetical protein M1833_007203 [Piccolia ochrophora]|nr:MAG: hypothetical protein M1833_007203 [Piccolia ochrophora]